MKKKVLLIAGWIFVTLLIIFILAYNPNSLFVNGTIVFGWLLFILQITWNNSETLYIHLKKYWFLIKNPDCIWNMVVEFDGDFDEETFKILDNVINDYTDKIKITTISNVRRIYKLDTLSFELTIDKKERTLRLHIDNMEISFRRSRTIIDKELGILFEKISQSLRVINSEYYFNISFREFNPYYGFFIRRLNANDINSFNVTFNVEDQHVTINKKSMEIYTTSLQKLNVISKEYLSLSPR